MEYLINVAILACIYAVLALGLNLVVGFTGLLSVAQASFYGLGAYATAILLTRFGMNFFLALLIGVAIAAVFALLIGLVLSKFKDDYYALASLGFNVIVYTAFLNLQNITRGPLGIPGIARPTLFGFHFTGNLSFLILSLVAVAIAYLVAQFVARSSFGRALKAIREDEPALRVFGYRTLHFKLAVFVIGAALAALAGALFATYITFVDPSSFTINESIFLLAVIILGGLANLRGSILGAVSLIVLPEILRFVGFPTEVAAQMRQAIYGALLVILMLYRPQGLMGEYKL